ncbi:M48 family metalloprotease [Oceanicoccus sagamiensis]|uniref:M48 family metalloprotease n=1 Tax=Oceanicoccus sagamiensis TaxID=716816 RepID=UPI0012F4CFBE|nr:M48 family metalloprotease [Oceanicoccus sagamiensis]
MTKYFLRSLLFAFFCLSASSASLAQSSELPEFGESYATTIGQEYFLGRAWLMSFRRQAPTMADPLIQTYVEDLIYRLAATSELKDRRLELILVDQRSINAFAVPGGVVGVNTGLMDKAESEAQFASVLTHELAHVSQRHFARGIEAQKKASTAMMAGLLAGVLLAVTEGGAEGMAAMAAGSAAGMQSKLRYSRLHEQEADRIGMKNMVRAQMNPQGAEEMFKIMQAESRGYARPPEFLLTHPLTDRRISDARNRSREYPRQVYPENLEYQLMRSRVALSYIKDDEEAIAQFRDKLAKGGRNAEPHQYGLVLALIRGGQYKEAKELLAPLREFSPSNMTYGLAEAELLVASGQHDKALELLNRGMALVPGNYAISMALADAYIEWGEHPKAAEVLEVLATERPRDPNVWFLLAESQGKAGNILRVHQARAEYFVLNGATGQALQQLKFALAINSNPPLTNTRISERIKQVQQIQVAMGRF